MDRKFESWLGGCEYLVQDFESCLRSEEALEAFKRVGVELVDGYPRCSQDFNAIENAWDLLRKRLQETLPKALEKRDAFVLRLLEGVRWINKHRKKSLEELSRNQKTRCEDCVKLGGARTKWSRDVAGGQIQTNMLVSKKCAKHLQTCSENIHTGPSKSKGLGSLRPTGLQGVLLLALVGGGPFVCCARLRRAVLRSHRGGAADQTARMS